MACIKNETSKIKNLGGTENIKLVKIKFKTQ